MGSASFVGDVSGRSDESLFAVGGTDYRDNQLQSVTVNTTTFAPTPVGIVANLPLWLGGGYGWLTGTGDGRLFFDTELVGSPGPSIVQIDPKHVSVVGKVPVPSSIPGSDPVYGFASFAFWGGDFYFFVNGSGGTVVHRFDPASGEATSLGPGPSADPIWTVAVSTCAPTHH
jgi:hypothetical protein